MDVDIIEAQFTGELIARHHHASDPEENDLAGGKQRHGRIESRQVLCLLRPAKRREGPQPRGKPGIENVLFLNDVTAAAFLALFRLLLGDHLMIAFLAVVDRNPVAPPQLPGDTPVADIFSPVEICLLPVFGVEMQLPALDRFYCRFGQRLHADEPLLRQVWFDDR